MGLIRWLRAKTINGERLKLDAWRQEWRTACAAPDRERASALSASLNSLGLPEEEIEIEREMIEALEHLLQLQNSVAAGGLPIVATGHRVVGSEPCHFSVPASMPDDASQPSGRLFFTRARAIFAGGARSQSVPWHAVVDVLQQDRDVILVRHDRETLYRFRCNVFSDALSGAFLGRALSSQIRNARGV
jgi:hypothetical protein